MALPSSGAISLEAIAGEFGGASPHAINEYYRGGILVPNTGTNVSIPTSGQVSWSNYYNGSQSLLQNLRGYFQFEEASASADLTNAHASGFGNVTRQFGSATSVAGKVGNARHIDTTATVFGSSLGTSTVISTTDYTMCGWFKRDAASSGAVLVSVTGGTSGGGGARIFAAGGGNVQFNKWGTAANGNPSTATSSGTTFDTNWHFFMAWTDSIAGTQNLQIDNGTVNTVTPAVFGTYNTSSSTPRFCIMGDYGSAYIGNSNLMTADQFGFWNRTLNAQERSDLWNGGAGLPYSSF